MAEKDQDKPYTTQPTTVTDLKRRYAEEQDGKQVEVVNPTPFAVEGNDVRAYGGVSEEYATYADDRQKPFVAEGGPEAEAEERIRGAEAGLTTKLPRTEQTFTKPEKSVRGGVAPSAKAVGGIGQVGSASLGVTADKPVPATVEPKFEDSDFQGGDEPEAAEQDGTPVAETPPADVSPEELNQANQAGEAVTETVEPKKASKPKAPAAD